MLLDKFKSKSEKHKQVRICVAAESELKRKQWINNITLLKSGTRSSHQKGSYNPSLQVS